MNINFTLPAHDGSSLRFADAVGSHAVTVLLPYRGAW
jgi:hypothetical protein